MRKIRFGYIAFVLLVVFASCDKNKKTLTENIWKVCEIKEHADSAREVYFIDTYLSFIEDRYILQTYSSTSTASASNCIIGRVKIKKNNIDFEFVPIGDAAIGYLVQYEKICNNILGLCIKYYEISGDSLILTGDNGETIILRTKVLWD